MPWMASLAREMDKMRTAMNPDHPKLKGLEKEWTP